LKDPQNLAFALFTTEGWIEKENMKNFEGPTSAEIYNVEVYNYDE